MSDLINSVKLAAEVLQLATYLNSRGLSMAEKKLVIDNYSSYLDSEAIIHLAKERMRSQ